MSVMYATVSDITALGKSLTLQEQHTAEILLETASAKLRLIFKKHNSDLDKKISENSDFLIIVKSIIIQSVMRALTTGNSEIPATQGTVSAMGYSQSYTYLNAGQNLYFLKNELKELGLFKQTYGVIDFYDSGNYNKIEN